MGPSYKRFSTLGTVDRVLIEEMKVKIGEIRAEKAKLEMAAKRRRGAHGTRVQDTTKLDQAAKELVQLIHEWGQLANPSKPPAKPKPTLSIKAVTILRKLHDVVRQARISKSYDPETADRIRSLVLELEPEMVRIDSHDPDYIWVPEDEMGDGEEGGRDGKEGERHSESALDCCEDYLSLMDGE